MNATGRVVQHDGNNEAWVVGRGNPGECNPVLRIGICTCVRVNLLGCSGLTCNLIPVNSRAGSCTLRVSAGLLDNPAEHVADRSCRLGTHHPRFTGSVSGHFFSGGVFNALHDSGFDTHPVIGDGLVDARHLKKGC